MATCSKCGIEIPETETLCENCKTQQDTPSDTTSNTESPNPASAPKSNDKVSDAINDLSHQASDAFNKFTDTADTTSEYSKEDIDKNKVFAILAYFGFLVFVPIFAAKDSKYAQFHANQGLVLFLANIIIGVCGGILSFTFGSFAGTIRSLLSIAAGVLAIIGIVNAYKGQAKELPLIGSIKILKK